MATLKTANTTGKYHDLDSYYDTINYITQQTKTIHNYIGHIGLDAPDYAGSMYSVAEQFGQTDGVHIRHFIVSFAPWEAVTPDVANLIGWEIIGYLGRMFQAIFAVHEDEPQLHLHIVINAVSFIDGRKYRGTRQVFHQFENFVRRTIQKHGINTLYYVPNK